MVLRHEPLSGDGKRDFFIIFSLSRCGSTALHRALNSHKDIECLYEPTFALSDPHVASLLTQLGYLRARYSGIKLVWDPSGFPFRSDHRARIDDMEQHAEEWLSLNEVLLSQPHQRVVFLRRRDALARTISDLLGQQTNLWGPGWDEEVTAEEGAAYRSKLKDVPLRAIDLDLLSWYLTHLPHMEDRLRRAADTNPCLDLDHEDLFGDQDPREVYREVLAFLGHSGTEQYVDEPRVAALLGAGGKLNTADTLRRIPNYAAIERRFGPLSRINGIVPTALSPG